MTKPKPSVHQLH